MVVESRHEGRRKDRERMALPGQEHAPKSCKRPLSGFRAFTVTVFTPFGVRRHRKDSHI